MQRAEVRRGRFVGALQHQADVGMGDQPAIPVDHECQPGFPHADGRNDIPNQLEVDLRHGDADGRPIAGDGHGHVGLGAAIQRDRAIPDARLARAKNGRIAGAVEAAADDVPPDARDVQAFDSGAVHERHVDDGRHLAQQPQGIDAVVLDIVFGPGQLDDPAHLISDAIEKALDLACSGRRLDPKPRFEQSALIAVAEPGFTGPVDQQGNDNGDEEGEEILLK